MNHVQLSRLASFCHHSAREPELLDHVIRNAICDLLVAHRQYTALHQQEALFLRRRPRGFSRAGLTGAIIKCPLTQDALEGRSGNSPPCRPHASSQGCPSAFLLPQSPPAAPPRSPCHPGPHQPPPPRPSDLLRSSEEAATGSRVAGTIAPVESTFISFLIFPLCYFRTPFALWSDTWNTE